MATPVLRSAEGRDRWRGEVIPLDEHVTHFLPVTRRRKPRTDRGISLARSGCVGPTLTEDGRSMAEIARETVPETSEAAGAA